MKIPKRLVSLTKKTLAATRRLLAQPKKRRLVVGLALIVGGLIVWRVSKKNTDETEYRTAEATRGSIVSSLAVSGEVVSTNVTEVVTGATGIVTAVNVQNGQTVTKGQKLITISLDQAGQQQQSQAYSSYLSAKNNLVSAQISLYTLQSAAFAANQKLINDAVARELGVDDPAYIQQNADWLAAEAKYKNQQAVIAQSQSALNSAWLAYQLTSPVVVAPASGELVSLSVAPGMAVGDTTSGSSFRVAVIRQEGLPVASFNLSELDVIQIKNGQKATMTLDSFPEMTFTGRVVAIDMIGSTISNVTQYPVLIQFDTQSAQVLSRMSATANIVLARKDDVLLVPAEAVQTQAGQSFVQIFRQGQPVAVPVEIGLSSDTQTEIISGLEEGETVITGTVSAQTQSSGTSVFGGSGVGGMMRVPR